MSPITFRSSRIVYYGPHSCENCGASICKMGNEWGGTAFSYPEGPIYPNTEWHPHVCDPELVERHSEFKSSIGDKAPDSPARKLPNFMGIEGNVSPPQGKRLIHESPVGRIPGKRR